MAASGIATVTVAHTYALLRNQSRRECYRSDMTLVRGYDDPVDPPRPIARSVHSDIVRAGALFTESQHACRDVAGHAQGVGKGTTDRPYGHAVCGYPVACQRVDHVSVTLGRASNVQMTGSKTPQPSPAIGKASAQSARHTSLWRRLLTITEPVRSDIDDSTYSRPVHSSRTHGISTFCAADVAPTICRLTDRLPENRRHFVSAPQMPRAM